MFWEEPSSASKVVKIAHKKNAWTVTVHFLNCYCLTSPQIFNYIWSYRTPIQAKFMELER